MKRNLVCLTVVLTIVMSIFSFALPVSAADSTLTQLATWSSGGVQYEASAVYGNYLYISTNIGMKIFDISTIATPVDITPVGNDALDFQAPQTAQDDMQIIGNKLYAISWKTGEVGLRVLDLTNPASPTLYSKYLTDVTKQTSPRTLQIKGNYAYVGGNGKLQLFDLNTVNSTGVEIIGCSDLSTLTSRLYGDYIIQIGAVNKIYLDKLTSPTTAVNIGYYTITEDTSSWLAESAMEIIGNYLYIGVTSTISGTIYAFDITNPESILNGPETKKTQTLVTSALYNVIKRSIAFKTDGEYLFRADIDGALAIYNVFDPLHIDSMGGVKPSVNWYTLTVDTANKRIFASGRSSFYIYNYTLPTNNETKYEVEFETIAGTGVQVKTDSAPSDYGYLKNWAYGDSITVKVNAFTEGKRTFKIKHSNVAGTNYPLNFEMSVNGGTGVAANLLGGAGWGWSDYNTTVNLVQGENTIKLTYKPDGTNDPVADQARIDFVAVGKQVIVATDAMTTTLQFESSTLSGVTKTSSYVGSWTDNGTATFTINAAQTGARTLAVNYQHPYNSTLVQTLIVNGVEQTISYAPKSPAGWGWSNVTSGMSNANATVNLVSGSNTIQFKWVSSVNPANSGANLQLDWMTLTLVSAQDPLLGLIYATPQLYNAVGDMISQLPEIGTNVTVSVNIVSQKAGTTITPNMYAACYDINNKLLAIVSDSNSVGGAIERKQLVGTYTIPVNTASMKVFIWDDTNLKPILLSPFVK